MIVTFPARPRYCASCHTVFAPFRPSHRLCPTCWRWSRIGHYVAATRRLLAEAVR